MLPDKDLVAAIIKETAALEIMPLFRKLKDHEISDKESGEIVTAADVRAEERLTKQLTGLMPGSVAVGEEAVDADENILNLLTQDAPVWVIDPLDGTRNFANGKECFAVIIAYCVNGETLAGWIYDPVNETMFYAAKGSGAWANETKLQLKKSPPPLEMRASVGKRHFDRLNKRRPSPEIPGDMVRYRCIGREYGDMLLGELHFAEYAILKPWDHAAGLLMLAEAGGFAAYVEDQSPYVPEHIQRRLLLAAANEEEWHSLRALFVEN